MHEIALIVVSGLFSSGAFALIEFFVRRYDEKKGTAKEIKDRLEHLDKEQKKSEKDHCRTQLLLMLSDYPTEIQEILILGERYFSDLHGNWYMYGMYQRWLEQNHIKAPIWFEKEEKHHENE